jgi:hypothetical protein
MQQPLLESQVVSQSDPPVDTWAALPVGVNTPVDNMRTYEASQVSACPFGSLTRREVNRGDI